VLTNHAITRHYPDAANAANPPLAFLQLVIASQARLIARWLQFGFIHGVMNTDNMAVSGETIDFGPCAFMDAFHPQCVFSSIDQQGRYAWGNQPSIGDWNLTRLAETLLPLIADSQDEARALAEAALDEFGLIFQSCHRAGFREKLGIPESVTVAAATAFIDETLTMMARAEMDFTLFFRHLTRFALGADPAAFEALYPDRGSFDRWIGQWRSIAAPAAVERMRAVNPVIIPRNHRVEEAIRRAYDGDFAPFHKLADALERPFEECPANAEFERAPEPHEVVHQTFCGT
jgi:uncharacterized protein YdiU (UPF0061 family)